MKINKKIDGDRNEVITNNLGLVRLAVKRYSGWLRTVIGVEEDDLFSIGCIGLIRAYELYDPDKGNVSFSNYAFRRACTSINRYIYNYNPTLSYPRRAREVHHKIYKENMLDKPAEEISRALEISLSDIDVALNYHNCKVQSLNAIVNDGEGEETEFENFIESYEDFDSNISLSEIFSLLNDTQKEILRLYYFKELTRTEIGKRLNISQPHVGRIMKKIGLIVEDYINNNDKKAS